VNKFTRTRREIRKMKFTVEAEPLRLDDGLSRVQTAGSEIDADLLRDDLLPDHRRWDHLHQIASLLDLLGGSIPVPLHLEYSGKHHILINLGIAVAAPPACLDRP
jgi:hypothetical protein